MNWTEILRQGGVPESPGYQELLARIREEKEAVTAVEAKPAKGKRGKRGKRAGNA